MNMMRPARSATCKRLNDALRGLLMATTQRERWPARMIIGGCYRDARDPWGEKLQNRRLASGALILGILIPGWFIGSQIVNWIGPWILLVAVITIALAIISPMVLEWVIRRSEIKQRTILIDDHRFIHNLRKLELDIPDRFALIARAALATAYGVPPEIIDASDSRHRISRLMWIHAPLAIEVISDIMRRFDMEMNGHCLLAATTMQQNSNPSNVGELIDSIKLAIAHTSEDAMEMLARVPGSDIGQLNEMDASSGVPDHSKAG